jgi:uncharacterized protein
VRAIPVDEPGLQALVYGGAVLGGGGGGSLATGLESLREILAAGVPRILPLAAMEDDAILATLSAVGSAGGTSGAALSAGHFKRALSLFESFSNHPVEGYLAREVGPRAVTYGLRESIESGVPVVDAPANGRAHPLFVMGSLGLHLRPRRITTTVAVGGVAGSPKYVEIAIRANVNTAARIVRDRAAQASIPLAVIRNPLPAAVVRHHAAVGALAFAQRVGHVLLAELTQGPVAVLNGLARAMGGRVLATGRVSAARLSERLGFTLGVIKIRGADGSELSVPVCNEFMAVMHGSRLVAGFPDLIALFDGETGLPLASPEVRCNHRLAVFTVPRRCLLLGSPMEDRRLLRPVERLLGARIAPRSGVARA